jgi:hypothetical protein
MEIIEVLCEEDTIRAGDWVKARDESKWYKVEDRIPFWVNKKLGDLNTTIVTHAVIRFDNLPYGFPPGKHYEWFNGVDGD